jgi:hypothetical protein
MIWLWIAAVAQLSSRVVIPADPETGLVNLQQLLQAIEVLV